MGHRPWFEVNPARLLLEKKAMERYPDFKLVRDGDQIVWLGKLTTNRNNSYEIALYYPDDFPVSVPKVYPINPPIAAWKKDQERRLKHQYPDGSLCLYFPLDRADLRLSEMSTAATMITTTAAWLFAYEEWLDSDRTIWPGKEAED